MVVVQDPPLEDTTPTHGPLGALTLGFGEANALGKQHISVNEIPIGAGFSSPNAESSNEVYTYIRHLERKINNLMTAVDRDMHVRGELVEIKRLLQMSPLRSSGSSGRRSHHSPPHKDGGVHQGGASAKTVREGSTRTTSRAGPRRENRPA